MELEIKHLAPYLPYGVKVQGKRHLEKYGVVPILNVNGFSYNKGWQYEFLHEDDDLTFAKLGEKGYLPILRPLSDLTKEITHNGESFMPMLKLFELAFNMSYEGEQDKFDFRELPENGYSAFELNRKTALIYRDRDFYKETKGNKNISNQYKMFSKLFEWHFDFFNLIPQNLAIDINTLNQKT